jgi:hypothetical protein
LGSATRISAIGANLCSIANRPPLSNMFGSIATKSLV